MAGTQTTWFLCSKTRRDFRLLWTISIAKVTDFWWFSLKNHIHQRFEEGIPVEESYRYWECCKSDTNQIHSKLIANTRDLELQPPFPSIKTWTKKPKKGAFFLNTRGGWPSWYANNQKFQQSKVPTHDLAVEAWVHYPAFASPNGSWEMRQTNRLSNI